MSKIMHTVFGRSLSLVSLTLLGFLLLELLVQFGGSYSSGINARYPELMPIIRAFAIMTWAEVGILWIRKLVQSQINIQDALRRSDDEPMSAAIAYGIHIAQWLARMVIFLKLAEFL